jgi:hypothetical protein
MSDGIDLTEILGIDPDIALELAQTSSVIARARAEHESEQRNGFWEREAFGSGQTVGQVNLASLGQAELGVLQTATIATQAAVNLLVVDRAPQARDLFRLASALVTPYSSNDALVLGACANPAAVARAELDLADATVSSWISETVVLLHLASGGSRTAEMLGATPPGGVGAGASGEPPTGISLASLLQLRIALSGATPDDGPEVWNAILANLSDLVADASSPFEQMVGAEWWANQTGSVFPLEPEVLMFGLIGAMWRRRRLEFGLVDQEDRQIKDRELRPRLAVAVSVAADRLLETPLS